MDNFHLLSVRFCSKNNLFYPSLCNIQSVSALHRYYYLIIVEKNSDVPFVVVDIGAESSQCAA